MARAARVAGERTWLASAQRAADFVRFTLWRDGRLLATWKDGRAHLNAYLDDHASMLDALLELMEAEFRLEDLQFARALADLLLEQFEDRDDGGFFFVSRDHERLIVKPKTAHDSATPSGNGIAAYALQRLGHLVGDARYLDAAERAIRAFYPAMSRQPSGFPSLMTALDEHVHPLRTVVLRGGRADLVRWQAALAATYRPDTLTVAIPGDLSGLPDALAKPVRADATAWICQGTRCLEPLADLASVEHALAAG
jgi:uncharacterized protein YyaL (SSP411 family)